METQVPAFSLTAEPLDQVWYYNRLVKMLNVCDPTMLLYTDKQVREAVDKLKEFEKLGSKCGISDSDLWHYRKLKDSAVHPDTGELIPRPFRMSGYMPFNGPICVGLVMATKTPWILFGQWANQSHNALVNYYNRNASSPTPTPVLLASYGGAVSSAMGIAWGLSRVVKNFFAPERALALLRFVALPTSIVASSVNCIIMRRPEMDIGIGVFDKEGVEVGKSRLAAKAAIESTVLSRILLQIPVFVFPPIVAALPPVARYLRKYPKLSTPVMTGLMFVGFGFGLPASIAAFPVEGTIRESEVESEFRGRGDLTYNKGL